MAAAETSAITQAFDQIAPSYDATFSESLVGRAQREAVWQVADRVFTPGSRILEINCGTGVDALHFAGRGVRVLGCDASAGMVEAARKHGKAVAMITDSVEGVRQMIALGATIINYSSDTAALRSVYAAVVEEMRRT